jgi:hypothetical protein
MGHLGAHCRQTVFNLQLGIFKSFIQPEIHFDLGLLSSVVKLASKPHHYISRWSGITILPTKSN